MNAAMVASLGCDLTQISLLFFLAYSNAAGGIMKLLLVEDAAQQYKTKGGTQEFSHHMARAIGEDKIMLNHPVTKVALNNQGATVHCANGKVVRGHVLCMNPIALHSLNP